MVAPSSRSPFLVCVIPLIFISPEARAIVTLSTSAEIVFADLAIPFPAVICPAPENCVNVKSVSPNVIDELGVNT